jgi:hypothetical protein
LATNGDFNGGGPDLLVGGTATPFKEGDEPSLQRAFLFLGTATEPTVIFQGNGTRDQFGKNVSFIPDVTGDGHDEILISAPNSPTQNASVGMVYLFFSRDLSGYSTSSPLVLGYTCADIIIQGERFGSRFGDAIAINSPGDVIVGAPGSDLTDGTNYPGKVYVFSASGSEWLAAIAEATLPSAPPCPQVILSAYDADFTVSGSADADRFGFSVAVVGEINGVAGEEFVVGAPQVKFDTSELRGATGAGYADVFDASGGTPLVRFQGTQPFIPNPNPLQADRPISDGEGFGFSVAGGVDIGGGPPGTELDQVNEIFIGAILYDLDFNPSAQAPSANRNAGAVHVFSGASFTRLLPDLFTGELTALHGEGVDQGFGTSILGIQDTVTTNGGIVPDTFPDLVVGAYVYDEVATTVGTCNPAAQPSNCTDPAQGGANTGAVYVVNGKNGDSRYKYVGEALKDGLGFGLAAGDLDLDGHLEVISGGFRWSCPAGGIPKESGRVYRFEITAP